MQHEAIDFLKEESGRNAWAEYSCTCCSHSLFHMFDEDLKCHFCKRRWDQNRTNPTHCPHWQTHHQKRLKISSESSNGVLIIISFINGTWHLHQHKGGQDFNSDPAIITSNKLTIIDPIPFKNEHTQQLGFLAMSQHIVLTHPTNAKQLPDVIKTPHHEWVFDKYQQLPLLLLDRDTIIIHYHS